VVLSLAVTDDTVYVPGWSKDERDLPAPFVALARDGTERWSVETREARLSTVADDAVVFVDDGETVCLGTAQGTERWRHDARDRNVIDVTYTDTTVSPVVTDGLVYLVSDGGDVDALRASS